MRLAFAFFLLAAGCGDSGLGTGGGDLATRDMTVIDLTIPEDLTPPPDLRPVRDLAPKPIDAAGIQCNMKVCAKGELCCGKVTDGGQLPELMCAKSCPDGGIPITCDGPEDCNKSAPICCANITAGAGNPPLCPLQGGSASCQKDCQLMIPDQCPGMARGRLCHQSPDCAGTITPACCNLQGYWVCLPEKFMGFDVRQFLTCN